jgi:hypothetical protein
MTTVLLCDAHYLPLREIGLEHAIYLLVSGKAEAVYTAEGVIPVARLGLAPSAVENWSVKLGSLIEDGKFVVPSAIRLYRAVAYRLAGLRPSRHLVFKRDRHTCQYCGAKGELTLDHVMPSSRGGQDTWENLVAACGPCNHGKANRTPEEAGMRLASKPRRFVAQVSWDVLARLTGCPA